jgi:ubiquinone/menaquinone biosynthesis C-methylase UbiE
MAAGAVDRFFEVQQQSKSPPLWLQRHTGPISEIATSAKTCDELIGELGLVGPGSSVVDAGCGFGVMAPFFSERVGSTGRYLGFDSHGPSIRWAQRFLATTEPRFRFVLSGVERSWPVPDSDADLVLAKSLFTHLTEEASRHAFQEIARVLKRDGRALVTTFLFEEDRPPDLLLPFPRPGSPIRWRWKNRPQAMVAYERVYFSELIAAAGLRIEVFRPGFWPRADRLQAQDVLVLASSLKAAG